MSLDFATLDTLRTHHPAWRLLRSEHAPLVAFLASEQAGHVNGQILGRTDYAYTLYRHVLQKDPNAAGAHYGLAFILLRGEHPQESVRHLEAFLANDGSMAATHKQLFTHRHTIRYRLERAS